MNYRRVATVARTDLRQLAQAKDFWVPMSLLGSAFFIVVPTILLLSITTIGDVEADIDAALEIGVDYIILDGRGGGTGRGLRQRPGDL